MIQPQNQEHFAAQDHRRDYEGVNKRRRRDRQGILYKLVLVSVGHAAVCAPKHHHSLGRYIVLGMTQQKSADEMQG